MNKIASTLFRGFVNKDFVCEYSYEIMESGKYATISQTTTGKLVLRPSFRLILSEGFNKNTMFIGSSRYYQFTQLLQTATKTISDHLYEIFPDIGKLEFEIDSRVLQRYQTEKAMSTAGITAYPVVWVDPTDTCYPAIRIETIRGFVSIPLEDAIAMTNMFQTFDPQTFGLSLLRILGKVE